MVRLPRSYWRSRLPTNLGRLVAADSADRVADEQADLLVLLWRAGGCPGNGGGNCAGLTTVAVDPEGMPMSWNARSVPLGRAPSCVVTY